MLGLALAVLALVTACKANPRAKDECASVPDFLIQIRAKSGALPADTKVEVNYGGTLQEVYRLSGHGTPQVVFCESGAGGAGDAEPAPGGASAGGASGWPGEAGSVTRLSCELWTAGPAQVIVTGSGLADANEMLSADPDFCTVEEDIELEAEAL